MNTISLKKLSEQTKIDFYQLEKYIKYLNREIVIENNVKKVKLDDLELIIKFINSYSTNEISYIISHNIQPFFCGTLMLNLRKKYNLNDKQFKTKIANIPLDYKYVYSDEECKIFNDSINKNSTKTKAELREMKYINEGWIPLRQIINDFGNKYNFSVNTGKSIIRSLNIEVYKPLENLSFLSEEQKNKFEDFLKEFDSAKERRLYFQEKTCQEKYGVNNPTLSDGARKKISIKSTENAQERLKKARQTNLEKYGVENTFTLFDNKKYWNSLSDDEKENRNKKISNSKQIYRFENLDKLYLRDLSELFNKDSSGISRAISRLNIYNSNDEHVFIFKKDLQKLIDYYKTTENSTISYSEKEIVDFIKSICDYEIIENNRDIISPMELDIYIPSKKLAIEFDGIYWHNELYKDKNYHLNKTLACEEKGIDLIHVFEDDWRYNQNIMKSMIASRLGVYQRKIFARKCEIKEINKDSAKRFFNENHLQGFVKCDYYLSLLYNNQIVQCVAITEKGWHDGNVELTRMVTKLNIQVIGGFSKLMKSIYDKYHSSITSYVFRAWFNGKGYLASGFKIVKENPPSYSYVLNGKRIHKSHFRKNKLKKMYECNELKYFNKNKTEHEIMLQNNIYRIYDCGTIKVVYEN
jgi:hypothetical protein